MLKEFLENECSDYTIDFRYSGPSKTYIVKVTKEDKQITCIFDLPIFDMSFDRLKSLLEEMMAEVDQKLRDKEDMIQRKKDMEKKA